ncbi:uncharacterized protein LOC122258517 [Penaeus japonicus]|uniref:uncharacterized protein LOC122258517 n=1 Tax=Penaeus japonicus TaxID=27405 RepID=UPI001C712673|nr:uncharacterized protein LOC122258517 [Penaeus japonicus]
MALKNGKATGPDEIPVEAWEALGEEGVDVLRESSRLEKHREKQKALHMVFTDLECCDKKCGEDCEREEYMKIMLGRSRSATVTSQQELEGQWAQQIIFMLRVGLYQGSGLSTLLFNMMFDVITEKVRAEGKEMLERKLEEWRQALENRGMRISKTKTQYFTTEIDGDQHATTKLNGVNLKRVETFKHLGLMVDQAEGMEKEVSFRIQCGWSNWRKVYGVICDRRVPVRVKSKVHTAAVKPALIYGLGAAPLKKVEERKLDVAEMKMLRRMSGVTRRDRTRN